MQTNNLPCSTSTLHALHSPSWQTSSHSCIPQFRNFPHGFSHIKFRCWLHRIREVTFLHLHDLLIIAGHCGHGPGWHKLKMHRSGQSKQYNSSQIGWLAWRWNTALLATDVWGSIPGPVKSDAVSPTARHRWDASSSELCCPGAKPQKWALSLVTHFGVIPRV